MSSCGKNKVFLRSKQDKPDHVYQPKKIINSAQRHNKEIRNVSWRVPIAGIKYTL
jgi:hypothetical protein